MLYGKQAIQLVLVNAILLSAVISAPICANSATNSDTLIQEQFLAIEKNIKKRHFSKAKQQIIQMGDHPLTLYLQQSLILANISKQKPTYIERYLNQHQGTWRARRVATAWAYHLKKRHQYKNFTRFYAQQTPKLAGAALGCFYLESLIRSGETTKAFDILPTYWLTAKSQPDECDYPFAQWKKSPSFSETLVWQRYVLTQKKSRRKLSQYLTRQLSSKRYIQAAKHYQSILRNAEHYKVLTVGNTDIDADLIELTIKQLAKVDPEQALDVYVQYSNRFNWLENTHQQLNNTILRGLEQKGLTELALLRANDSRELLTDKQVDYHFKRALADLDWQRVLRWLELLPDDHNNQERWKYWRARAKSSLGKSQTALFADLAGSRNYYGFLAARMLETPNQLNHIDAPFDQVLAASLRKNTEIQLAFALHKVRYYNNARQTWNYALKHLSAEQWTTAARLAHWEQFYFPAIRGMITAKFWDDTEIRFPLAYESDYRHAASTSSLPISWLYAISRQESSFAPDIRSHAGATGLMQLMPATAKETAKKAGLTYSASKLKDPSYNTQLGSQYLSWVAKQFNGNPAYASAAYNAGPTRVKRWLKGKRANLPLDAWIETIPFSETRNYVQNVFAFSVIYAKSTDTDSLFTLVDDMLFVAPTP